MYISINPGIIFFFLISIFALILRLFYLIQRKLFVSMYYSFSELVTGLPTGLNWTSIFLIRFLPPFVVGVFAYVILHSYFQTNIIYYALIGGISAFINIYPELLDVVSSKGRKVKRAQIAPILLIYLLYLSAFSLLSLLGAYFASGLENGSVDLLPSWQGIRDGLWIAFIILILKKLNEPID